jgi:hypothetical protein
MMMNFKQRLSRLEVASGFPEVVFRLRSGQLGAIRRKKLLLAANEAIENAGTRRSQIMLNATRASDGSQLHVLAQAIASGGVPHGGINE